MRGESWTRQPLSDAWDATNWDNLRGAPRQMVAPEVKMTKKVAADKEGAGPPLPRSIVERIPESEPRRFYVLSAEKNLMVRLEVVLAVPRWHHSSHTNTMTNAGK